MNLRGDRNSNAQGGDLDALKQISQLTGDDVMKGFLEVVFNFELNQGEDSTFKYMETYRKVVEGVVEKQQGSQ